jgi:mRNA-degrading endonuclease RelE of RelBE toxin-antitoxin system
LRGCTRASQFIQPIGSRIRVGDYRIVYLVKRDEQVIDVIDIDHRKDIYR